jgi:hypothetical protein
VIDKAPVLLVVALEPGKLRWFVAGVGLDGEVLPLLRSEEGNLAPYVAAPPDEQVLFLRHRLAGVLQRGCDRLWSRDKKACRIVFAADRHFERDDPGLTQRVAEHFATWMLKPPVSFFLTSAAWSDPACRCERDLAGSMDEVSAAALDVAWPKLRALLADPAAWELSSTRCNPA